MRKTRKVYQPRGKRQSNNEQPQECPKCGRILKTQSGMDYHMKHRHARGE